MGGVYYLRIFRFDLATRSWDTTFDAKYPLEAKVGWGSGVGGVSAAGEGGVRGGALTPPARPSTTPLAATLPPLQTNSIGDFNMIDNNYAMIIERDDGEGDA